MKIKSKLIAFTAVFAILATGCASLTSCNKNEKPTEEVPEKEDGNPVVEEEADPNAFELPENLKFDGETFSLYVACSTLRNNYISDGENGTQPNDAVFHRNEAVKERLGIDLNFVSSTLTSSGADQAAEKNKISSLILAGDKTYDAFVHVQHSGMPSLIEEGLFIDWNKLPHVNFEKPWWYANTIRDICFGNKVFCMTGDYNLASLSQTECLVFNKTMLDELELEYPYAMVYDGTWTHDKFLEYINAATKDLNGNGEIEKEFDRFGFVGWQYEQLNALYVGYGGETLRKDDSNMPVLNIYTELQNTIIDKMIDIFRRPGAIYEGSQGSFDDNLFKEGRVLFKDSFLEHVPGMREHEFDFGFVPYPKLNEEQENYYSRTANISGLTYIPVTLDEERYPLVGATLETLAYYGHEYVIPEYFDILLTVKSTRDIESEEMIPIIRNSSRFMDQAIGFSASGFVTANQNTLASHWASAKTTYEEKLNKLIAVYSEQ